MSIDELANVRERSELLDAACGVGLWEAVLHNADALHEESVWTWSPEFRRLLGYTSERDFPNVCQSWSDRLHPDDIAPTFAAFAGHLTDMSGNARYDVTYRLKVSDGSYSLAPRDGRMPSRGRRHDNPRLWLANGHP